MSNSAKIMSEERPPAGDISQGRGRNKVYYQANGR